MNIKPPKQFVRNMPTRTSSSSMAHHSSNTPTSLLAFNYVFWRKANMIKAGREFVSDDTGHASLPPLAPFVHALVSRRQKLCWKYSR
jgi:hypothetical protein